MAFIDTRRRQNGGGGGGGQTLAWARDNFYQVEPFGAGLILNISEQPIDINSISVWSQGMILGSQDWEYADNFITILFSGNPAIDYPETGLWIFEVQYPYATT